MREPQQQQQQQQQPSNDQPSEQPEQPLESTRGSGNVLEGYRSPGDERHHRSAPNAGPHTHDEQPRGFGASDQALNHGPGYGNWGGPEAATPAVQQGRDQSGQASTNSTPQHDGTANRGEWHEWGTPAAHYGGAQGAGGEPGAGGAEPVRHDPDYHAWHEQQMREMDQDYETWRNERRDKFSQAFDQWRKDRHGAGGTAAPASGPGVQDDSGSSSSGSSTTSIGT